MILEHLISAYLDGELTPEQDKELRESLASDPTAREAFDAAVLIHIGLRCEDRTMPPSDLRRSVFDAIDVIAAEEEHRAATLGVAKRPIKVGSRGAGVLAAVFLVLCVPVADLVIFRPYIPDVEPKVESVSVAASTMKKERVVGSQDIQIARVSENSAGSIIAEGELATHDATDAAVADAAPRIDPDVPLSTIFGGVVASTTEWGVAETAVATAESVLPVYITTSYAAGMASSVPGADEIRQVSASLAYGVSEQTKVGLEIGSTSYSMTREMTVLSGHPAGTGAFASAKPAGATGGSGKLSSPEPSNADYVPSTMTIQTQETQFWGTAFVEHKLFALNAISISGRLGAGIAEDGVIGYGRLAGEWKVGGPLSIVAGAETRAMPFRTGGTAGTNTAATYGAIVTAITGLNIRF